MTLIYDAIGRGIDLGVRQAFSELIIEEGDCFDDPEDRCCMEPKYGCVCLSAKWDALPWWQKLRNRKPPTPDLQGIKEAAVRVMIDNYVHTEDTP